MLASSSSLAPTSCCDDERSCIRSSTMAREVAQRVPVLQHQHVVGDLRRHVRVAVAVAADPAAERQRPGVRRQLDAERGELVGQLLEHVAHGVQHQLVEVVGRVAGLVQRLRPVQPQLGGLPEQVDDLGDPPVGPGVVLGRRAARPPDVAWTGWIAGRPRWGAR